MKINSLKAKELDSRFDDGEGISDYLDLSKARTRAETGQWNQRKELQAIEAVVAGKPEIQIAILFGSLAEERAGPASDIDIGVAATQPLTAREKIDLIEALCLVTGRPVDLVDLRQAGEPLLGHILQGRRLLVRDKRLYAELIKRHLFDSADFLPYRQRLLAERRRAWTGT